MIDYSGLPLRKGTTKLDRAIASKASRLTDAQQLVAWAFAVKTRDQWRDRCTGRRLLRTRSLDPLRAEAHHIVDRSDRAVRYDVRNGLCLSLQTHETGGTPPAADRRVRLLREARTDLHRCHASGPVRAGVTRRE